MTIKLLARSVQFRTLDGSKIQLFPAGHPVETIRYFGDKLCLCSIRHHLCLLTVDQLAPGTPGYGEINNLPVDLDNPIEREENR